MTFWWRRHRSWLTPAFLLAPGLILFLVIIVASSIETFWISFFEWDGIGPKTWIGLGNYVELLDDPQFYTSLKNNVIWLLMFLAAPPAGLAIALLVNQKIAGMRLAKSLFFMPLVLAAVTVGVIFNWFYDPTFGLLAIIYNALGTTAPALLSDEHLVTFR